QKRVGSVTPDLAERPPFHVAEGMVCPERVGMHVALGIDISETHARARPCSPAHFEELEDVCTLLAVYPGKLQIDIDPVHIIFIREDSRLNLAGTKIQGTAQDEVHDLARFRVSEVVRPHMVAPTRIDQVRKTDLRNSFTLDKIEDRLHFRQGSLGQRQSQTHLEAGSGAVSKALQRGVKGPFSTAKAIMRITQSLDRDPHIVTPRALQSFSHLRSHEGAI